ncbi:hypothetical protein VE03_04198 [Pseudogymnoascus sp. 23342-1-I1]|nr:hypothetical protein VE03_04198 [Pseudogymnoascus sp. 23342-1-I1]
MSPRCSEQRVSLRSLNMDLILYATLVPLFAMIVAYQVYASPDTPFVYIIHNGSFFGVISPENSMPVITYVMDSNFSLPSWAISIKLPSPPDLLGSCLSILTRESLHVLASTAQWATDKLFTCEISYMITIAITSFFTDFFHVTYLQFFISTTSLLVTYTSHEKKPKEHNSLRAARQQFKYKIFALCCVIITSIEHTAFVLITIRRVRSMVVDECWGPEGIDCHSTWFAVTRITMGVLMVLAKLLAVAGFISVGTKNVLEDWKFVEAAREREATRDTTRDRKAAKFDFGADAAVEGVINVIKQSGRFAEDEKEGEEGELFPTSNEVLAEIIRLYAAKEEALQKIIRQYTAREEALQEMIRQHEAGRDAGE